MVSDYACQANPSKPEEVSGNSAIFRSQRRSLKSKANSAPSPNGLKAMVVDDNPITLKTAAAMMKRLGYAIGTAEEGGDALYQFHKATYDLILTDYHMPVMSGYQLCKLAKMKRPNLKVIIMTGLCQAEVANYIKRGEVDAWLFKPFGFSELKTTLEKILDQNYNANINHPD